MKPRGTAARFARRVAEIEPFHVMALLARARELEAQGRSIIHMEIGEPDFPTPDPIVRAGVRALEKGDVFYTPTPGLPQLREAIAALLQKLDPHELEQQLGRRGAAGPDLQARLWERYRELFRATAQAGDAGLPAAFLAAFARAYESITAGGAVRDPGERDEK